MENILNHFIDKQKKLELNINSEYKSKNGIFFTNSNLLLDIIINEIENDVFHKKILEPSCGFGIFILDYMIKINKQEYVDKFLKNLYFMDINESFINYTIENINECYFLLFKNKFEYPLNYYVGDFTKLNINENFDYIIGNPPFITMYGRRDNKKSEDERNYYLRNYKQFPTTLKNGKINTTMLFIEKSIELLKPNGKISFILDISFFEKSHYYIRKYILENYSINKIIYNIKEFDIASGQIILVIEKNKNDIIKLIEYNKNQKTLNVNKIEDFFINVNEDEIYSNIINKLKNETKLFNLYDNKNLRTSTMLLNFEKEFVSDKFNPNDEFVYMWYNGSKSLTDKYCKLNSDLFFYYNVDLQNKINEELKYELTLKNIKNKKRIGLGDSNVFEKMKIFIRQSSNEIISTIDKNKSASNNSLYIFSCDDENFMYFLCGLLNSKLMTFFCRYEKIIRSYEGKQPQISINDLKKIFIPIDKKIQKDISILVKKIYDNSICKDECINNIDEMLFNFYGFNENEKKLIINY